MFQALIKTEKKKILIDFVNFQVLEKKTLKLRRAQYIHKFMRIFMVAERAGLKDRLRSISSLKHVAINADELKEKT